MHTRSALLAASAALSLGFAFGCSAAPSVMRSGGAGSDAGVTASAGLTRFGVSGRGPAPLIDGQSVEGAGQVSSSHPGRVVVVNVWQSTCGPCRGEAAALEKSADQTVKQATFVGLDVDDQRASAQAFLRTSTSTYAHLYDPDGEQLLKFAGVLPLQAIPSTLVIDRHGRIAARIIGPIGANSLTQLITDIAAES